MNEPEYIANNDYMNAFAIAWLFQVGCLYFLDKDVTWDGKHHDFKRIQFNHSMMPEVMGFVSGASDYAGCIEDFMLKLECQEDMVVPRERIHPALYGAIHEGDLTGATLLTLLTCDGAIVIDRANWKSVQKDEAGRDMYTVECDENLLRGIPGLPNLLGKLVKFMREYNERAGSFCVNIVPRQNAKFAASFLGGNPAAVAEPVEGAVTGETSVCLTSGEGYTYRNRAGEMVKFAR